jgi:hypothetical protein
MVIKGINNISAGQELVEGIAKDFRAVSIVERVLNVHLSIHLLSF